MKKLTWKTGGLYDSISYIDGIFEYRTDGTREQNLLHIMDSRSLIAMIRIGNNFGDSTPAIQYNLEDNLGSSAIHLEDDGANINKEEYYPFGEASFGSYAEKRYKYCAKERDKESGLYYYGARYYSAWICKFVSVDPLAKDYPFYNSYNYAGNKPVNKIDVDGMYEDNGRISTKETNNTRDTNENKNENSGDVNLTSEQKSTNIKAKETTELVKSSIRNPRDKYDRKFEKWQRRNKSRISDMYEWEQHLEFQHSKNIFGKEIVN